MCIMELKNESLSITKAIENSHFPYALKQDFWHWWMEEKLHFDENIINKFKKIKIECFIINNLVCFDIFINVLLSNPDRYIVLNFVVFPPQVQACVVFLFEITV